MKQPGPFWQFFSDMREVFALAGTLAFSFTLWMLWGFLWFPIIDWLFERLNG